MLRQMKGMKPKKIHEVEQMVGWVDRVCQQSNADFVLDIGAGSV